MAERSGNQRGSASEHRSSDWSRTLARRELWGLCLGLCSYVWIAACEETKSADTWPAGTVVAIDHVPISADEIAGAVAAVILVEPQWSEVHLKRLAFNEIALPRAIVRTRVADSERDKARRSIDEEFARIAGGAQFGPPTNNGAIGHEVSGSWKQIGLLAWGTAMNLENGAWSEVIEVPGAFLRLRTLSRKDGPEPAATEFILDTIEAPYAEKSNSKTNRTDELEKHRLTIVDPAWDAIVPERTKYLMGIRQP